MEKLQSHSYIIKLFTTLVNDDSIWTNDPPASVQDIWPHIDHSPFTKSSWVTVQWMDDLHNVQPLAPAGSMLAGNGDIICTPDDLEDPLEGSDLETWTCLSPASVVEQLEWFHMYLDHHLLLQWHILWQAFSFGCFFSTTVPSPSPSGYYLLALHIIFLLKIYFLQPIWTNPHAFLTIHCTIHMIKPHLGLCWCTIHMIYTFIGIPSSCCPHELLY